MITHRQFYGTTTLFFFSLGIAKLLRLLPFFGSLLIILGLFVSLALIPKQGTDDYRIVPIGGSLGFFLELYLVQLDFVQEAFEFLTVGVLALAMLVVNSKR